MSRSPEAIRFLKLLLPEFIMARVLPLFYTLLNGGILQSTAEYDPPGEYAPLCNLTPTRRTRTHTHMQVRTHTHRAADVHSRLSSLFLHLQLNLHRSVCVIFFFFFFCSLSSLGTHISRARQCAHARVHVTHIGHKGWK